MKRSFPSPKMRLALAAYALLWWVGMPLVLLYFLLRSAKDPRYRAHMGERFGVYPVRKSDTIWIHAVSLGELRSAAPLIQAFLDRGEQIVTTHLTPAGRAATHDLFAKEIRAGKITAVYAPFEIDFLFKHFFRAFRPKLGLSMEIEIWPRMIASARKHGVPLFACNAQYPERSFNRDKSKTALRGELVSGLAGAFVKSELHADRFRALGQPNVAVTGELRFEQNIPKHLTKAAKTFLGADGFAGRPVVTIASSVVGEDELYLRLFEQVQEYADQKALPRPVFIHVPRAPERFDAVGFLLANAGQKMVRRSVGFDDTLKPKRDLREIDILLGDSLGEMYFYLSLADAAIVGGGFHPKGAHNVIEALALEKPVLVGPEIWPIEYPAREAIKAGVVIHTQTINELGDKVIHMLYSQNAISETTRQAVQFNEDHSGATRRTLAALPKLMRNKG